MESKVVSNTGPLLHLNEINFLKALTIFHEVFIPGEVELEFKRISGKNILPNGVIIKQLLGDFKDISKSITERFSIDIGESQAIALAIQEKAAYFLTDDLDAREIAKKYGLEAHGTAGIILRTLRNKLIDKKTAIQKIVALRDTSSLYITKDIVSYIIGEIERFKP